MVLNKIDSIRESVELQTNVNHDAVLRKSTFSEDNEMLSRTGKKPVLKRNFGFMSILGFSCLILSTWQGAFVLLGVGLEKYSATQSVGDSYTAPTAGGQYHWVSLLAPKSNQKVLSYITGWLTVAGWQANVASSAYVSGTLIQGFIEVLYPDYSPMLWHATLLLYGALALSIFTTTVVGTALPRIESTLLVIYTLGFFGVLVPLVYLGPHGSASEVFTTFNNGGGWSSQGLSFFVGISGNAFAFLGADSMSEEIRNAATVVPRSIVWSIVLNGIVGLSMFIAILFCIGDLDAAVNSDFIYPFIEVLLQATRSVAGTAVIIAILIIVDLGLVIGVVAASSRMLWSFARDRGVPGWRQISKLDSRTSIPVIAIVCTTILSILIGLISIGSPVAFNDVISLTVSGLYASYFVACILLLWRRCTGSIKSSLELLPSDERLRNVNLPGSAGNLVWGPWRVPEPFGTVLNAFACMYLAIVFFFSFWPPATPVTPNTMNYSSLVMGFAAIMSGLYYVLVAHKTYTGPVVDMNFS
ncbi:hypothetical protein MMC34_005040 [Xylographa carneopallida]|nr:hypothetical protein [Xylographa carneopallida]